MLGKAILAFAIVSVSVSAGAASAECRVWAVEDSSAGGQRRERVFASSDLQGRDELVAEAAGIARRRAAARGLDFIDVFLTRPQDGTNRADHSQMTSTVQMRYNPGRTPVIDGRMQAQVRDAGAAGALSYGMLDGPRSTLPEAEIRRLEGLGLPGVSTSCR